jgi:hypothetical protein
LYSLEEYTPGEQYAVAMVAQRLQKLCKTRLWIVLSRRIHSWRAVCCSYGSTKVAKTVKHRACSY